MNILQTTDRRICDFYNKNPKLNFDAVNLWMVEFFEKIMNNNGVETATNTLIPHLNAVKNKIIQYLKDTQINEINVNLQLGFLNDKILTIITEQNPNTPLHIYTKVNELLKEYKNEIMQIIPINSINNFYITEFINKFEDKLNKLFQSIHVLINSIENVINQQMNTTYKQTSLDITSKIYTDFTQPRTRPSSPSFSEQRLLSNILSKLYPSSEIINGPEINEDEIMLKRMRKTNILIKNHDLETNILLDDINNCLHSAEEQRCNCIIISQYSGISTKKNYQIDVQNNMITVYVHNAEYNHSRIQAAVDIIDNLSSKFNQYKQQNEEDIVIPKDIMDTINDEYQLFISQKIAVVDVFKDHQKKVLAQIDELRFPSLDKLLSTKYLTPVAKPGIKCELCKSYFANNLKALAAHKRGCNRKINNKKMLLIK